MNSEILFLKHFKWATVLTHFATVVAAAVSIRVKVSVIFIHYQVKLLIAQLWMRKNSRI